jgi:hypothetical protein
MKIYIEVTADWGEKFSHIQSRATKIALARTKGNLLSLGRVRSERIGLETSIHTYEYEAS